MGMKLGIGLVLCVSLIVVSGPAAAEFMLSSTRADIRLCTVMVIYSAGEKSRSMEPATRFLMSMFKELLVVKSQMDREARMGLCARGAEKYIRKEFGEGTLRQIKRQFGRL